MGCFLKGEVVHYRSKHVSTIFNISHETVRTWSNEFGEYLSPTARPGARKQRLFTKDDMSVFSLVSELKKQGMTFDEIHASLKNGERGELPTIDPSEVQAIVSSDSENRLALEVERMQHGLVEAHKALTVAQKQLKEMDAVKTENTRLKAQLESEEKHYKETRERLEKQISELTKRVEDVSRQSGQEYVKGFVEGIKHSGVGDKKADYKKELDSVDRNG